MTSARIALHAPDADLIHRFLAGDERAFRSLYERHTPRLKMTVIRLLGTCAQDADDIIQDTWLSACRGMQRFRGDAQFPTWLTSIGVRAALAHLERRNGRDTELLIDAPARDDGRTMAAIDVERALALLSDKQRAVVVLHDIEGFTHEEIGEQLGIATSTSKVTLFRARDLLRNVLNAGAVNSGAVHGR